MSDGGFLKQTVWVPGMWLATITDLTGCGVPINGHERTTVSHVRPTESFCRDTKCYYLLDKEAFNFRQRLHYKRRKSSNEI